MVTQGLLGEAQMTWLTRICSMRMPTSPPSSLRITIRVSAAIPCTSLAAWRTRRRSGRCLRQRKHVKAYIHGHIHHRNFFEHEGIHILNTPATSYVADKKTSTTGWTMAKLNATSGSFTTYTRIKPEHELEWRESGPEVACPIRDI
jgi:Icc protein